MMDERTARARRAGDVFDDCAADKKRDAELNCAKEPARLPDGSYAESEAECLRLWAEGTPGARDGVTKTGTERQAGWKPSFL